MMGITPGFLTSRERREEGGSSHSPRAVEGHLQFFLSRLFRLDVHERCWGGWMAWDSVGIFRSNVHFELLSLLSRLCHSPMGNFHKKLSTAGVHGKPSPRNSSTQPKKGHDHHTHNPAAAGTKGIGGRQLPTTQPETTGRPAACCRQRHTEVDDKKKSSRGLGRLKNTCPAIGRP